MKTRGTKHKKYRKVDAYHFLTQMYRLFRTNPEMFIIKRLRGCHGEYDPMRDRISVDFRREIFPTIIHETIHCLHPQLSERAVIKRERQIVSVVSVRQARNILKRFVRIL